MGIEGVDDASAAWDLRHGEPSDRAAVRSIWHEQFGRLDGADRWLDDALGDNAGTVSFVAADGGSVVGFAVVSLLDPGTASGYVSGLYSPEQFPRRTAVIHMLAVDDGYGDMAIGSALTDRCMQWAAGETAMMLVVLWRREDHVDSSVLAEQFDFETVARIKGYYRDRRDYCPDCGPSCTCDATVHVRPLRD